MEHQYKVQFSIFKEQGIFFKPIITVLRLTSLGCLWSAKREMITLNCDARQKPNLADLFCGRAFLSIGDEMRLESQEAKAKALKVVLTSHSQSKS